MTPFVAGSPPALLVRPGAAVPAVPGGEQSRRPRLAETHLA